MNVQVKLGGLRQLRHDPAPPAAYAQVESGEGHLATERSSERVGGHYFVAGQRVRLLDQHQARGARSLAAVE